MYCWPCSLTPRLLRSRTRNWTFAYGEIHIRVPGEPGNKAILALICNLIPRPSVCNNLGMRQVQYSLLQLPPPVDCYIQPTHIVANKGLHVRELWTMSEIRVGGIRMGGYYFWGIYDIIIFKFLGGNPSVPSRLYETLVSQNYGLYDLCFSQRNVARW